jgi:nickel/cobalt exporter
MKGVLILVILIMLLCSRVGPAWCHNPFTSRPEVRHVDPEPPATDRLYVKITLWQYKLRQKMAELVRLAQKGGSAKPLMLLLGIAFVYGVIHAAGPGHGKLVAVSYVLSHRSSIIGGLLFGLCIAFLHGISGVIGVLGLQYIIQRSVNETLTTVTTVSQVASYGLVALLGLGTLLKNAYASFFVSSPEPETIPGKTSRKGLLPWAMAAGLVPCPAVLMVMAFCMSMDATPLGLLLTASISIGMAATISVVVVATIMGKAGALCSLSKKRAKTMEAVVGIFSGAAIAILGALFLLTTISSELR